MKEQILKVINESDQPMRARDIAAKLGKWAVEVAIECSCLAHNGYISQRVHRDPANMENYYLYGKKEG